MLSKSKPPNDTPVALITGGAKRLGAEITRCLHSAGYMVVIHYRRSADSAKRLQTKLELDRPDSAFLVQADLGEPQVCAQTIADSIDQAGRLDCLVNNASAFFPTPIDTADEKDWETLMGANLKAPLFLSQAALPHLRKTEGCIINLIDIYANRPLRDHPIYIASKAGLAALTRSLAIDAAPVRVNGIAPGAILWPENIGGDSEDGKQRLIARTPLKRLGKPSDIAKTALFLAKDAPFITGQIISVDGGRSVVP